MEHPSGLNGNSAVALISRDGQDNHDFDGPMCTTPYLKQLPYASQAMTSFDEILGRSRLMRLEPGAEVSTHVDFNYHWLNRVRVHIPVVTEQAVTFWCGDQKVHMKAGECWIFDSWSRHRVTHEGSSPRVHLVIDLSGSSRFWRMVTKAPVMEPIKIKPDNQYHEPRTERFNTSPIMAPGELDALVDRLLADLSLQPANNPELLAHYEDILSDFKHDWRQVWYEHGPGTSGIASYRAVIKSLVNQLSNDPRALTTASNDVGANPVIIQRIARAALVESLFQTP